MEAGDGLPSHWEVLRYGVQQRLRIRRLWRRELSVDHSDPDPHLLLRRELGRLWQQLRLWQRLWLRQRLWKQQLLLSKHKTRAEQGSAREIVEKVELRRISHGGKV